VRLGGIVTGRRRRAVAVVAVALAGLVAACGVEVPDDVAEDLRTTTTTTGAPSTTETPTSDDELEQALIDNGYTQDEAVCGAENLRAALDEDGIRTIIDADTIEDISASTARAFANALRPCVEDGAGGDEPPPGDPGDGSPGDGDGDDDGDDDEDDGRGGLGRMPGFGDDSEGDVSRSRFLSALISGGIADDEARCIVAEVFDQLDQGDINALFHAESSDDVPDDVLDTFMDITDACR
jgi:hypothetical protein